MDQVQDQGWSDGLANAVKYIVDLFLEGDVTDIRYWIVVVLTLSVIWGPVALYFIRKRNNGPKT